MIIIIIISGIYLIWASGFIYRNSYIAIDGHRYFSLFDDAMISMRYAWDFARGLGLGYLTCDNALPLVAIMFSRRPVGYSLLYLHRRLGDMQCYSYLVCLDEHK